MPAGSKRRSRWLRILLWMLVTIVVCLVLAWVALNLWRWTAVPSDAPVIGISGDTAWHAWMGITTKNYEIALIRAGAKIAELRPGDGEPENLLDRVDALLLAGGGDIDPQLYGEDPRQAQRVDRQRDEFEIALIRGALRRDMPILGICRGIQIINVAHGGSLQNIRQRPKLEARHGIGLSSFSAHDVTIVPNTKLAELVGSGPSIVNSFHGQAVGSIGQGLRVVATTGDGLVEGVERPDRAFVVAVQWHPEVPPPQPAYFLRLVEEARRYRQRRQEGP